MQAVRTMWRGVGVARGIRGLARRPVTLEEARRVVTREMATRAARLTASLDRLVWPHAASPARRLLAHAGLDAGAVRELVERDGVTGALETLRDAGVYVSYEEYQGRVEARRGSTTFAFSPADFFNPVTSADYLATTGGSRGTGTPVELSFAWQRRQGVQRAIQFDLAGVAGAPGAIWLPVFPSAAGFGAVMKNTAGGNKPERWFSQVPTSLPGIASHKQMANRLLPALQALSRAGLPSPEHVPSDDPAPVVAWLQDALRRAGRAFLTGYASSITAAARYATEHGIDLTGAVAFPASEPVTAGKLASMRAAGMRPFPMYAFVPEGTVAISCDECEDEEYHLWEHELALATRTRPRGDGTDVPALCWTSLAIEAPRVLLNVENDDYGTLRHDVACGCPLGRLGLTDRLRDIRGISKVVAAGISLDGELFDHLAEVVLPARVGGGPGDYQFVEEESADGTVVALRVDPAVAAVDVDAARTAIREALATSDNGVLADGVWARDGLRVERAAPVVTKAGKRLSFERMSTSQSQGANT
ncbi:MAG TPA: hypothetical protein VFW74_08050 [Acidimicrobiia bacterium]|nr:hypothetical protein [Acidimicrobiia bacterium]